MKIEIRFISKDHELLYEKTFSNIIEAEKDLAELISEGYESQGDLIVTVDGKEVECEIAVGINIPK